MDGKSMATKVQWQTLNITNLSARGPSMFEFCTDTHF